MLPQALSHVASFAPQTARPSLVRPAIISFRGAEPEKDTLALSRKKVLWVINPKAGGVQAEALQEKIRKAVSAFPDVKAEDMLFFQPTDMDSLKAEIQKHADSLDRVVAAGGDGTITRLIQAVLPYPGIKIGILPMGTGNRMAYNLGIPLDFEGAVKTVLTGTTVPMDVGQVHNGDCFALMAGVGLDAAIMKESNKKAALKRKIGVWAYVLPALTQIVKSPVVDLEVEVDGQTIQRKGIGVLVANTGKFFANFSLTPGAKTDDGIFDVAILAVKSRWDYIKALYQVFSGKIGSVKDQTGILHIKAKNIKISSTPPVDTQVDGDVLGKTPMEIKHIQQVPILVQKK